MKIEGRLIEVGQFGESQEATMQVGDAIDQRFVKLVGLRRDECKDLAAHLYRTIVIEVRSPDPTGAPTDA